MNNLSPLQSIRLRDDEAEKLDSAIFSHIQASDTQGVRFSSDSRHSLHNTLPILSVIKRRCMLSAKIALSLILAVSAGTAGAAEFTAPGNPIYPVKVSINEEVRAAFTVGAEADARWDIRRIERRQSETTRLAARGRLDAQASTRLANQTEAHVASAQESMSELEARGETEAAVALQTDLASTLSAFASTISTSIKTHAQTRTEGDSANSASSSRTETSTEVEIEANVRANAQPLFEQLESSVKSTQNIIIDLNAHTEAAHIESETDADSTINGTIETTSGQLIEPTTGANVNTTSNTEVETSSDSIEAQIESATNADAALGL